MANTQQPSSNLLSDLIPDQLIKNGYEPAGWSEEVRQKWEAAKEEHGLELRAARNLGWDSVCEYLRAVGK